MRRTAIGGCSERRLPPYCGGSADWQRTMALSQRCLVASATVGDPCATSGRLIGVDPHQMVLVEHDRSARGAVEILLWHPEDRPDEETAALLAGGVAAGSQTMAFVQSRRSAEVVAMRAQQQLGRDATRTITAYRAGYLANDRRALERALQGGTLDGVATTNALELGIDIAGVDAVIITGFPGTRAAFWQQAGRAGRKGRDARVILVERKHPIDAFLSTTRLSSSKLAWRAPYSTRTIRTC